MKENIQKLYKAMGLQKWLSGPEVAERANNQAQTINLPNELNSYVSWLEAHPCAVASFQKMKHAMRGKKIVVFLDYDGTLSPIVNDPDRAYMSDSMRSVVRNLAKHFPTAIISGRSREKVYAFVKLDEVYYAGSHGMDIMGPPLRNNDGKHRADAEGNEFTVFQPAREYLPSIEKMLEELKERTLSITGAFVEDNRFCISVHYRHVLDEDYSALEEIVNSVVSEYSFFHVTRGKKVMEIRPSIEWNKGNALLYLLDTLGFSDDRSDNIFPFYIGDDKTDEDAFKVLRNRGQGYPIIVSSKPKETLALYSLRDPAQVMSFLGLLSKWAEDDMT